MKLALSGSNPLRPVGRALDRWLFRLGKPERLPLTFGQRRIYVLPTGAGYAFAVALLVMLVASINYNLSLGYGLVFLLFGLGVVSIFHAFRNLLRLSVTHVRAEPVFAGEPARFRYTVRNDSTLVRHALTLASREARSPAWSVDAGAAREVLLDHPTLRRGWVSPGRLTLETRYPLGLVRVWTVFIPDARCLVYPLPESPPPPLPEGGSQDAGLRSVRDGDDDFAGLRAHRDSDSPRHVAWKVVARGGPMMTKRFTANAEGDCELDWQALPPGLDTEQRVARMTAWVLAATGAGRRFTMHLPGGTIGPASGDGHTRACLARLATFGLGDTTAPGVEA
jgi:uncharacterized protein (DUF58 family)